MCAGRGPGPSAALAALVISGLPTDRFVFEGFLPRSGKARVARLRTLASEPRTVVLFESPRRLEKTLRDLLEACGDRRAVVARELTKLHQEVLRGGLSELVGQIEVRGALRGEVVVVLGGAPEAVGSLSEAIEMARQLLTEGARKRDAARRAAERFGVGAREVYERLVKLLE